MSRLRWSTLWLHYFKCFKDYTVKQVYFSTATASITTRTTKQLLLLLLLLLITVVLVLDLTSLHPKFKNLSYFMQHGT